MPLVFFFAALAGSPSACASVSASASAAGAAAPLSVVVGTTSTLTGAVVADEAAVSPVGADGAASPAGDFDLNKGCGGAARRATSFGLERRFGTVKVSLISLCSSS